MVARNSMDGTGTGNCQNRNKNAHTTANGKEMEIVWGAGTLQTANAVSGEWRDYIGSSPLRFPLISAKDMQFFRVKGRSCEHVPPAKEEQEPIRVVPVW